MSACLRIADRKGPVLPTTINRLRREEEPEDDGLDCSMNINSCRRTCSKVAGMAAGSFFSGYLTVWVSHSLIEHITSIPFPVRFGISIACSALGGQVGACSGEALAERYCIRAKPLSKEA